MIHEKHSTTSKGKINKSVPFIHAHLGETNKGTIAGTVGKATGAARHVREWEALGFPQARQIMVEMDLQTYLGLAQWAEKTRYRGQVFHGTMTQALDKFPEIVQVDFDVLAFNPEALKTLQALAIHRIAKFSCTFTTRGNPSLIEALARKFRISRVRATGGANFGKLQYPTVSVIHSQIRALFDTHYNVSRDFPYTGVCESRKDGQGERGTPMVTFAVRSKES